METINILMLGGRRCGKTTVLSAMYQEIGKILAGTGLSLSLGNDQTRKELAQAAEIIQQNIRKFATPLTRIEIDDNPTSANRSYNFTLTVDKGGKIPFFIHDIPGEWLTDPQYEGGLRSLIGQCQVILIAIDTPYLFSKMTEQGYGRYHEEYNKPMEIANFFKNSLSTEEIRERMVLFVPLKCERYYNLEHNPKLNIFRREYMRELMTTISAGYRDLLQYLRSPELAGSCTLAITPILSAGGIDFVRFRKDGQTGRMVALYQEPEFLPEERKGYRPRFCEQPMLYALAYILTQTLRAQTGQNSMYQQVAKRLGGSVQELYTALETIQKKMKRNSGILPQDGYYIIQNPVNV